MIIILIIEPEKSLMFTIEGVGKEKIYNPDDKYSATENKSDGEIDQEGKRGKQHGKKLGNDQRHFFFNKKKK